MKTNPFSLMYGFASESIVTRDESIKVIMNAFTMQNNMFSYLITGIRGVGKTVLLHTVESELAKRNDWVVVNVNPQGQILNSIANKLYDFGIAKKIFGKITLTIQLGVITLTRESGEKTSDPEIIIEHILNDFHRCGAKVLISIDEVNDTNEFRMFINFYQILLSKRLPIYLLMTALPENVNTLINDKAMTFLSRTPRIELEPLELSSIAINYSEIFDLETPIAVKLAKLTNGYAFAYQVLGYLLYESGKKDVDDVLLKEYDKYLWKNGYNKFWQDLTDIERKFMIALAKSDGKKDNIIKYGFSNANYSQYRRRLLEKGLIYMPRQGELDFVLPRFKQFVLFMVEFE